MLSTPQRGFGHERRVDGKFSFGGGSAYKLSALLRLSVTVTNRAGCNRN